MADFTALKTAIQNAIKQNGNEEITGNILQDVLLAIVSTLGEGSINDLVTALGSEATTRSQADDTLQQNINAEAQARGNADTTLQQHIDAEDQARQLGDSTLQSGINNERDLRIAADNAMQSAITAISNHLNEGYIYVGIATTSTNPSTPSGKVFYIAVAAGTYTNFLNSSSQPLVLTQGINILKYNGTSWSVEQIWGVDDNPTAGSNKLVKSGGVFNDIMTNGSAFDLSAYNNGTTYADLNAALTALNALPAAYKRGGMSLKFVLTSDNNYAQFRFLLSGSFTDAQFTNVDNWQGVEYNEPTQDSKDLITSGAAFDGFQVGENTPIDITQYETVNSDIVYYEQGEYYYWNSASELYKGKFIPVTPNKKYYIKAGSGVCRCAMLTTDAHVNTSRVSFATDSTLVRINAGDYTVLTAPSNAAYLWVRVFYNGNDRTPSEVSEYNKEDIREIIPTLLPKSDVVDNLTTNDATKALSAKQGKVLKESINGFDDTINEIYEGPSVAFQLANDLDFFTGSYGYKNRLQYTKVAQEDIRFSSIRINRVMDNYGSSYNTTVSYKAYIIQGLADSTKRDAPLLLNGKIGNATVHTLIAEGTFSIAGNGYIDYTIELGRLYTCKTGQQVVVYMSAASHSIAIKGAQNSQGNPQETSNISCISDSSTPLDVNAAWVNNTFNSSTNTGTFSVALTLLRSIPYVSDDELETQVQKIVKPKLTIQIPSTVYAVVGTELNIYNDNITLSADKGLASPTNYKVVWQCSKGTIIERGFRFTPASGDTGNVSCTCIIYSLYGEEIARKTFTIKVLAKNVLSTAKRIVHFGDSNGAGTAIAMYNDFNDNTRFTGTIPIMLGTKGTTVKYEATGGYRWADFATKGRRAFRCQVSENESIALNSQYTNNGFIWTVVEVNIGGGNHNILITKNDVTGSDAPQTNGTLVPVGSGNSVVYTDATLQGANPLWNENTESLDIALYRQRLGLGENEKLDAVSFMLGGNASDDTEENIVNYITSLYNAFIADNPNCIFILCLLTSSANTLDGYGDDYGATGNALTLLSNYYRERGIYLSLFGKTGYSKLRIAAPNLFLDRYYGYPFSLRRISNRFNGASVTDGTTTIELPAKEVFHSNWRHPNDGGYAQIGDGMFGAYVGVLTE